MRGAQAEQGIAHLLSQLIISGYEPVEDPLGTIGLGVHERSPPDHDAQASRQPRRVADCRQRCEEDVDVDDGALARTRRCGDGRRPVTDGKNGPQEPFLPGERPVPVVDRGEETGEVSFGDAHDSSGESTGTSRPPPR